MYVLYSGDNGPEMSVADRTSIRVSTAPGNTGNLLGSAWVNRITVISEVSNPAQ